MLRLYREIWRISWRNQLGLIALALAVAGLAAVPLAYQKAIVNGLSYDVGPDSLSTLYRQGAEMAAVILLSLSLKWGLGFLSGVTGEATIRRLRHATLDRAAAGGEGAPPRGSLVSMVSAEAEEVGKFAGGAIAQPLLQLGTLVSVVGFIMATQPRLGLLALLVILPQAALVMATQRRVNALVRTRLAALRRATGTMTLAELDAHAAAIHADFDAIYDARRGIFVWKLSTKFLLSALAAGGTVGILVLGGWLVIEGRSDVGTVVAASLALSRLQQPWTQLVAFYRSVSAVRVKAAMLREALPRAAA